MNLASRANLIIFLLIFTFSQLSLPLHSQSVQINAYVSNSYGGGTGFSLSTSAPYEYSPASVVNALNAQDALWLLTCPSAPSLSPSGPQYFNNNPPPGQAPFGGNQCATHPGSAQFDVITTATLSNFYYDGYTVSSPFTSTDTSPLMGTPLTSSVTGSSLLSINSLGFGAQVDGYVSDIFSKSLNIFDQVPSANLHLLWTWFSEIPYISSSKFLISYSPSACDKNGQNCVGSARQQTTTGPYQTRYYQGDAYGDSTVTTCTYPSYTYNSVANVMNFGSTYIPYFEASGSSGSRLSPDPKIFPYLTYSLSVPSLFSQTLSLPYYLFSPSKYSSPANELDALPISIGGQFFVSVKDGSSGNKLAMGTQESLPTWTSASLKTTVTNPHASTASQNGPGICVAPSLADALAAVGETYDPNNPQPYPFPGVGGYLNSLYCNFCSSNQGSGLCTHQEFIQYLIDCTGHTYPSEYGDKGGVVALGNLEPTPAYCQSFTTVQSAIQSIPNPISIVSLPTDYTYVLYKSPSGGYGIDVLRTIPNGRYDAGIPSVPAAPDSTIWDAEWQQYWQQVIVLQNDNTYVSSQLSASFSGFTPLNMTVDYVGDIFLTGTMADSSGKIQPAIAMLPGPSSASQSSAVQIVGTTSSTSSPGKDWPMPEIAVAPGGKYVYLANQSDGGYIYQYSVTTATDGSTSFSAPQPVSLAYQIQDPATGQSSMLNIVYWLEHKGLYGQPLPFIGQFLSTYTAQPGLETDTALYHHPIGIQDVNGYLYVLDNWAGGLDVQQQSCPGIGQCNYNGVFFSLLTMRMINSSGLNVPINPTYFNDVFSTKASTCSITFQPASAALPSNCYPQSQPAPTCTPAASDSITKCAAPISTSCTIPPPSGSPANAVPTAGNAYICTTPSTKSSTYTSLSVPTAFTTPVYPPYGWFISANITATQLHNLPSAIFGTPIYSLGDPNSPSASIATFCSSSSCTYNPQNLKSNSYNGMFSPIGPQITALNMSIVTGVLGSPVPRAISSSADIRTKWAPVYYNTGFSVGFNESISLLFTRNTFVPNEPAPGYTFKTTNPNAYNALILSQFSAQNYTDFFEGDRYARCYTDNSSLSSQSSCKMLPLVASMLPPVYNMPDPLKFVEGLGGSQMLAFPGAIASSYQLPSANALSDCTKSISSGTICQGSSISGSSSSAQSFITPNSPQVALIPIQQSATVTISGQVLVPYRYTYDIRQGWSHFSGGTCITVVTTVDGRGHQKVTTTQRTGQTLGSPLISPPSDTTGMLYAYGTSPLFTNTIIAPLEGGGTYLQGLLNNYYQQNLSDIGTNISPQQIYSVDSNRQLPDTLVNITTNNLHDVAGGNQYILNASHASQYMINTYSQGGNPGYFTINSVPYAIAQNGIAAAVNVLSNTKPADSGSVSQNYLGANTVYSYDQSGQTVTNLFNFYISMSNSYASNLYLANTLLSGPSGTTYQALGYNRIIYVFRDRFNNTFTAPLDADISNPTLISLKVNPTVDQLNANKTSLAITGTATYTVNGQTVPLPEQSTIYVYYGTDLNFASYNPLLDPANAQSCAFTGSPTAQQLATLLASNCQLANPLRTGQELAASRQTYTPSYNALGDCPPAPTQLINSQVYNCNINDPASAVCPAGPNGQMQYCAPQQSDGSGICTSQLGLIGTTQTDSSGAFSINTIACGIGSAIINATYYGSPAPEPTTVQQTPLTLASNSALSCSTGSCTETTQVNNYYYQPTHAILTAPIGIFELSYGDIGIGTLMVASIAALLLLLSRRNKAIYRRERRIE